MDENIKQSIRSRKDAFSMSFQVSEKMQKKIDALFLEIEKLGVRMCRSLKRNFLRAL